MLTWNLAFITFIIFIALAFDFTNGLHDAANSVATVVGRFFERGMDHSGFDLQSNSVRQPVADEQQVFADPAFPTKILVEGEADMRAVAQHTFIIRDQIRAL